MWFGFTGAAALPPRICGPLALPKACPFLISYLGMGFFISIPSPLSDRLLFRTLDRLAAATGHFNFYLWTIRQIKADLPKLDDGFTAQLASAARWRRRRASEHDGSQARHWTPSG